MSVENCYKYLCDGNVNSPDSKCIITQEVDYTYSDLYRIVAKKSAYFESIGIVQGMKVALYSDNYIDVISSVFALWSLGATVIPMNVKQKETNLKAIEEIIQPDFGVYSKEFKSSYERKFPIMELQNREEEKVLNDTVVNPLALVLFTSGSSGMPKGVPITHKALFHNTFSTAKRLKITSKDRLFVNTPPYTTSSLVHLLTVMSRKGSVVIERGFMFGTNLLEEIVKNDCTGFGGVPVHFTRIIAGYKDGFDLNKLRFLMNSGDHLPVTVISKLRELIPQLEIYCVYGLTEVAGRFCILDAKYIDAKKGSVGKPLNGMHIEIRGDEGELLPSNKLGEIYAHGICLMEGYLNNEEVNKREMTQYGFRTGDLGYIDDEGFLYLQGRKDDIIKVGGEKVSVKMIEDAIFDFEDFVEFMVAPVDDEHIGKIPCLFYVLKEGVEFQRGKLLKFLREKLPSNHIPAKFVKIDKLERTTSGKTIRKIQTIK